ncbi:MAG TPA: zf-HC2 domain-containing protein [Terriglobales bacterium]|nr:zf-HC2 domain-containing protein [Terriglobales bacterium]
MLNRIFLRTHPFRCPDEHDLAAYVDQQLIGAERERVESHLAKCDSCLQQVGFLKRHADGVATVPARFLTSAKQLDTATPRSSPIAWQWGGAVAAIAIVAIAGALWRVAQVNHQANHTEGRPLPVATAEQRQAAGIPSNPDSEAETSVRSGSPGVSLPVVLTPRPGATVDPSDFIIGWEPIANAVAYEVRVVTADGSLVWRKRVRDVSVRPRIQTLRPGRKYFVWVRALLPDGESQVSAAVSFIGG